MTLVLSVAAPLSTVLQVPCTTDTILERARPFKSWTHQFWLRKRVKVATLSGEWLFEEECRKGSLRYWRIDCSAMTFHLSLLFLFMGNSHARRHFRSDSINYLSLGKIAFGRSYQNDERINQQPPRIFCSTRTTQMDRIDPDTFSDSYDIENTGRESAVSAPTPTLRERQAKNSKRIWNILIHLYSPVCRW